MTTMKGNVLKDGRIKTVTGEVEQELHQNAEAMFAMIAKMTGGTTTREARGTHAYHEHVHEHHHHREA